jgi:acyl-CoA synthetase (AMP-forming)/AMP-acid ligase II
MDSYLGPEACLIDHRSGRRHDRAAILNAVAHRAHKLRAAHTASGDHVVLAHGDGPALIVDLLAVWTCGATAVVVSHGITPGEREIVRDTTTPRAWIGHAAPDGTAAFAPAEFVAGAARTVEAAARLDDAALIMMTSGTTSQPKGVVLTHRAVQARLALNIAHMGRADLAVALTVLPMHFGHGLIGNTLTPLAAGASLVVWPEPGPRGLPGLGKVIDEHGVTFMSSVPSLWRVALKLSPPPSHGTLRRVHVGSAPLAAPLWADIVAWAGTKRVVNMYGITETANWIGGRSAEEGGMDDGIVGRPWGGAFRVRLADGTFSASGRGEVAVNSPSLMSGYLDRLDLTTQSLSGDWFLTGDIGEIDANGTLRLVGRSKHEINRGGIKVPAEEIDALLERNPSIVEACAFALPDALSGETVAAAIVMEPGETTGIDAIRSWCEARIRREALPARLFVLPALPRTDRGKLNRDIVRDACLAAEAGHKS